MTRIASPTPSVPVDGDGDPYRYGWRYVKRIGPDGEGDFDRVPLTLEDVLHPEVGDFIVNSSAHDRDRVYLKNGFQVRVAGRRGAVVLSDCRVAWDKPGLKPHGPDVAVIFGVRRPKRDWSTFDVRREGVRPGLIVEITSPDTRRHDLVTKVEHYHRAEVPWYVIVDAQERRGKRTLRLLGYRWTPERYEALPLDEQGRLLLEPLGLLLGVKGDRVVLYDAAAGEEVGDYEAVVRSLEAEAAARKSAQEEATQQRAQAEAAQAQVADLQARLRELEEQLQQRPDKARRRRPSRPGTS
jgi:Uma2 family endonuclease